VGFSLLEFRGKTRSTGFLRVGLSSLAIHSALIAGVVLRDAARRSERLACQNGHDSSAADTRDAAEAGDPTPVQLVERAQRVPDRYRTGADPHRHSTGGSAAALRSKDYSGSGIEGGRANESL